MAARSGRRETQPPKAADHHPGGRPSRPSGWWCLSFFLLRPFPRRSHPPRKNPYRRSAMSAATPSSPPDPRAIESQLGRVLAELAVIREILAGTRKPLLTVAEVARLVGRDEY